MESLKGESGEIGGTDLLEKLSAEDNKIEYSISFWYLSIALTINDDMKNANKCLLQSQQLLIVKSKQNTDENHWDKILYTNPINNQIMNQNILTLKEFTDSLLKKTKNVDVLKFCPECGFNNTNIKPFCPECGYNLKS